MGEVQLNNDKRLAKRRGKKIDEKEKSLKSSRSVSRSGGWVSESDRLSSVPIEILRGPPSTRYE